MIFISLVFKVYKSARFPVKTSLYDHKLLSSLANVPTFYVVPRSVVPVIARVQISGVPGLAFISSSFPFYPTSACVPSDVSLIYVVTSTNVPTYDLVQISDVSGLAPVPRSIVQAYECVPRIGVPAFYDVPRSEDPA